MEYKELKKESESSLTKKLAAERDKLRDLRFKDANKQLKDVRLIRKTRVNIARIITLLNQKRKDKETNIIQKQNNSNKTIVKDTDLDKKK